MLIIITPSSSGFVYPQVKCRNQEKQQIAGLQSNTLHAAQQTTIRQNNYKLTVTIKPPDGGFRHRKSNRFLSEGKTRNGWLSQTRDFKLRLLSSCRWNQLNQIIWPRKQNVTLQRDFYLQDKLQWSERKIFFQKMKNDLWSSRKNFSLKQKLSYESQEASRFTTNVSPTGDPTWLPDWLPGWETSWQVCVGVYACVCVCAHVCVCVNLRRQLEDKTAKVWVTAGDVQWNPDRNVRCSSSCVSVGRWVWVGPLMIKLQNHQNPGDKKTFSYSPILSDLTSL